MASVPAGDLIEAKIQFRMLSEGDGEKEANKGEKDLLLLEQGWFDRSIMEKEFTEVQGHDMDFDEFDPPHETRVARYACPYGEQEPVIFPSSQENQPKDPVTRAIALSDWIFQAPPVAIVQNYFVLGLTRFPRYLQDFLQKSIEDKVKPLISQVTTWKHKRLSKAEDEHEVEAINEKVEKMMNRLNRILLVEDPVTHEFNPIINDQGVEIDKRWTRLEVERLNHIEGERQRELSENQDWVHRMWTPVAELKGLSDDNPRKKAIPTAKDGLVKNMSGEEGLFLKRNKDDREFRVQRVMGWIERQTSRANLVKGLKTLNQLYQTSRRACFKRKNWAEIRYTKVQFGSLIEALNNKIKEVS
jgi:hypothetical protein